MLWSMLSLLSQIVHLILCKQQKLIQIKMMEMMFRKRLHFWLLLTTILEMRSNIPTTLNQLCNHFTKPSNLLMNITGSKIALPKSLETAMIVLEIKLFPRILISKFHHKTDLLGIIHLRDSPSLKVISTNQGLLQEILHIERSQLCKEDK